MTKITFEKATDHHRQTIFSWLEEPHVKEFWDNSQEHKDDIINFLDGRKTKHCRIKQVAENVRRTNR